MVSKYGGPLVLISCLVCLGSASVCRQGKQYLSTKLETCVNCTECAEGDVVLRPCEIHRDTLCGPISELLKSVQSGNPHRHKHHQRHWEEEVVWKFGNNDNVAAAAASDAVQEASVAESPSVTSTEAPFSGTETLVWDWQAVALASAVFICILFFLAITLYSLHQAKQWRRLKDNFDADVEELSARLSLMVATTPSEKSDISDPQMGPISDGNYLNNRCVYLEQLLNGYVSEHNFMGHSEGSNNNHEGPENQDDVFKSIEGDRPLEAGSASAEGHQNRSQKWRRKRLYRREHQRKGIVNTGASATRASTTTTNNCRAKPTRAISHHQERTPEEDTAESSKRTRNFCK